MLNSFRAFSGTFIVKIFMGLLVLSFGLWGVGDVLRQHGSNAAVATIGDIKISQQQFARELHSEDENLRQMMGAQYTPELAGQMGLPGRVLQRLVQQSLLALEARDIGIIPSDADILKRITANPMFQDDQGKFSKAQFQQILTRAGLSEKKYIDQLRTDAATAELSGLLSTSVFQPEIAARTLYEARKQQRNATLYTITAANEKAAAPTQEQLDLYYKGHAQDFTVPEFRTLSFAVIAPSDVPKNAELSEDEATQKYINKLEDAFAGGSTLPEVAKEFKLKVQSAGTVSRAGKTPDGKTASLPAYDKFLEASFAADEKSETQLLPIRGGGFYVVRVESIAPEHVRPFAEVKPAIISGWEKEEHAASLSRLANDISEKFKTPEGRAATIKQYNLSGSEFAGIKRDDGMSALPSMLIEDIFAQPVGNSTGAFATKNGEYMIAVVRSVVPAPIPDKNSPQYGEIIRQMRANMIKDQKTEISEEYFVYLEHKFHVDVNRDALAALATRQ